jgi:peptide/nickel transport system ATP-binding protein
MSLSVDLNRPDAAAKPPALRVCGLGKIFTTPAGLFKPAYRTVALKDISIDVQPSEILAIVGESGSGKTTIGRIVVGLLKPDSGTVDLGERTLVDVSRRIHVPAAKRGVGMIFQDPTSSLNPRMRVRDVIGEGLRLAGVGRREIAERTAATLNLVGLRKEDLDRYPHQFSGGQRQRIGIARALAVKPKLIVADEPVSALDVSIQAQVVNLLQQLQKDLDLAFIFIAHDLAIVRHMSDRVAVMYLGKIMEIADRNTLYNNPRNPYTHALLSAVPEVDHSVTGDTRPRLRLTGDVPSPANPPSGCPFRTRCPRAQSICAELEPPLSQVSGSEIGHRSACHFPVTPDNPLTPGGEANAAKIA